MTKQQASRDITGAFLKFLEKQMEKSLQSFATQAYALGWQAHEKRVRDLEHALQNAVNSWGDYVPHANSKAAKALQDAKRVLHAKGRS